MKHNYRLYPSLLDAFTWYNHSEKEDAFQELINKINRAPRETSEAAQKGIDFEKAVVDKVNHNKAPLQNEAIVNEFATLLDNFAFQLFTEANLDTDYGTVNMYGYVDAIGKNYAVDIKTTSQYAMPKYLHNTQHLTYMYCLRQQGIKVDTFRYLSTDFNRVFFEDYTYNKNTENHLRAKVHAFIEFLEAHKNLITDKKIFGL